MSASANNSMEAMKQSNKMRILFVLALPSAWLITWLIWFTKPEIDSAATFRFAKVSLPLFPLGLSSLFVWNTRFLQRHIISSVVIVYAIYAILIIWGLIRPYKSVFIVLCLMLLANIAGCHLEHTLEVFSP